MCVTGSARPSYRSKDGAENLAGGLASLILLLNGEDEKAFALFVPEPLSKIQLGCPIA